MNNSHKHCELIKAWADGAKIEWYNPYDDEWVSCLYPRWDIGYIYRIKPEPRCTTVQQRFVCKKEWINGYYSPNVEFTFDSNDKLIGVRLLND